MRIPELLTPLVARGVTRLPEQVLTFWHETLLIVFPPGSRLTLIYRPRSGYKYLVFGMTLGKPRDFFSGDVVTTDDYGFWHRHSQMRWHWDPAVESIYEVEYPHWLEVTQEDPAEMEFYNNTALTIVQDASIWLYECGVPQWQDHVLPYLKGWYNLFNWLGQFKTLAEALAAREE